MVTSTSRRRSKLTALILLVTVVVLACFEVVTRLLPSIPPSLTASAAAISGLVGVIPAVRNYRLVATGAQADGLPRAHAVPERTVRFSPFWLGATAVVLFVSLFIPYLAPVLVVTVPMMLRRWWAAAGAAMALALTVFTGLVLVLFTLGLSA